MIELKIPEVGESVQEALLAQWLKKDGESVRKDEVLFVIETDKVTLEISAPADGVLKILVPEGQTVKVGSVVGQIEETAVQTGAEEVKKPSKQAREAPSSKPPRAAPEQRAPEPSPPPRAKEAAATGAEEPAPSKPIISSSVRALAEEKRVDLSAVAPTGPGGRITEGDVLLYAEQHAPAKPAEEALEREYPRAVRPSEEGAYPPGREDTFRKPMSPIRQRIAARLLEARRNTAMLTTFNEIDMSRVQALRKQYGEGFQRKHGIRLGLMSFFIKASITALKEIPEVNAFIEGNEIVYHDYYHIGVAIGAERGLVVPVIRDAGRLGFAALEQAIADFAKKVEDNKIDITDLEGGTFTISNGGVFGSLLSTPILNPPQSAILGMHKIEDRPVVVDGQIVIRPMMYVALSYDHRLIDGREAVTFLRRIKDFVENPERIMMEI